ncbi:MAG: glycine oxidase ThiO [Actinomycetota bacterium]|nr:glycine oxidase ThiO [Actinomycetota bacterium]
MRRAVDLAVVGGGVIGCSIAYHAARRGAKVALLEAEEIGAGASGAAAGMLNAQAEAHEPGPFLDLSLKSRTMHRALAEELYEETGLDPEYVWSGTLRVALDERFAKKLAETRSWQREAGLSAHWLDPKEARELEPGLSSEAIAALYLPEDGQVNSPRLVRALALAAIRKDASVTEADRVTGFLADGERVTGVRTAQREILAGSVVLAGGSASGVLSGALGLHLPVHPVKGETLTVTVRATAARANVWDDRCYLVPKRDGRVIVGATEEAGVYDRRPTLGGVAKLSEAATRLLPEISSASFGGAWGGLRPGTPDGLPFLGDVEGVEGLFLATGHYRNGVLLAPVTGEVIAALALGETPVIDVSPFSCERSMEIAKR